MKRILIPTDFSETSFNAARIGVNLFKEKEVKFLLFHTFMVPYGTEEMLISLNDLVQEEARLSLEKEKDMLLEEFPEISLETRLVIGYPTSTIESLAISEKASLIIMGSKGAGNYPDYFLGSTTASVVRRVNCPVLIVPGEASYRNPAKIVLATEYETRPEHIELNAIKDMAQKYSSSILILNVLTNGHASPEPERVLFDNEFHGLKYEFFSKRDKDVVSAIHTFIDDNKAGILSVIAGDYNMFERIFHKSVSKSIVLQSKVPVMVLHGRK